MAASAFVLQTLPRQNSAYSFLYGAKNLFFSFLKELIVQLPNDPFVLELLPEFVDTWIQDIDAQFDELIQAKNSDELYRFGHTLKGSCFQFGLDEIAALGIELMGYAKNKDWENAVQMGPKLKQSFINIKKEIENT